MRRRRFLANLIPAAFLPKLLSKAGFAFPDDTPEPADAGIKRVLIMFKCHLDVGFVDTQANVVRKYFDVYFPKAIKTAASLREAGSDRYVWTTGSWLVYEYLEKASIPDRKRMEQALAAGDIAWHALPFTWQTELMEPSLIAGGLGLSQSLDRRFKRTTTGAKMTDVPGHTRALIGPLAEHGVKFLDIGVNSASTPPDVPPIFLWKDAKGQSLVVMYHHHEYGGVVKIPGSDLAIDIEVRNDNSGPHSIDEIHKIYAGLRQRFPNAQAGASNLSGIADAIEPHRGQFPVVTSEIGDTWIYGVPSDPLKVARYLEIQRLREEWIAKRKLKIGSASDLAFLSRFLLEVEHTWGTDTKTWLDFDHYTPADLAKMLDRPKYKVVQQSWVEKRQDLLDAVATLPGQLRQEADTRLAGLKPAAPNVDGLEKFAQAGPVETEHFLIAFDPHTGAISQLRNKKTGQDWASPRQPLALFSYQTLSKDDYDRFFEDYLKSHADWAPKDFGKPNIEQFGAESRAWPAKILQARAGKIAGGVRLVTQLQFDDAAAQKSGRVAWPQDMYVDYFMPDAEPVIELTLSWFHKTSNRMPEALWLSFFPEVSDPHGWTIEKSGSPVSPFDVVSGGNRVMHAALGGIHYSGPEGALAIQSLDAPVVSLGDKTPVRFTRDQPELSLGIHFNLFNNGWGTNYIQWFGEDMRFRFRIRA